MNRCPLTYRAGALLRPLPAIPWQNECSYLRLCIRLWVYSCPRLAAVPQRQFTAFSYSKGGAFREGVAIGPRPSWRGSIDRIGRS